MLRDAMKQLRVVAFVVSAIGVGGCGTVALVASRYALVLTRAFGVPAVLARALAPIDGIVSAFVFGSWAARFSGSDGKRPVEDIDLLVLGKPDRDQLYVEVARVEPRLGRPVQVTIRAADWLTTGERFFHDTVVNRPMVAVPLDIDPRCEDESFSQCRRRSPRRRVVGS